MRAPLCTAGRMAVWVSAQLVLACGGDPAPPTGEPESGSKEVVEAEDALGPDIWFTEEAQARGLLFEHDSGAREGRYLMPETITGGGALADLDGDGDLDAYLVQGGDAGLPEADPRDETRPSNQLFENRGGHFRDVSSGSGAQDRGYGMGVAAGDVDGDGDVDLFIANLHTDALLLNEGELKFQDTRLPGTKGMTWRASPSTWSTSAAFLDHDADGDLDLYVVAYLDWTPASDVSCTNRLGAPDYCSPKSYGASAADTLWVNDGTGLLLDRSESLGIRVKRGNGLGIGCGDFDDDGWTDIFVANDGSPDFLWHNLEGASFEEIAAISSCATSADGTNKAGMGVALADLDGDLDLDILVCNLGSESDSLHLNEGGYFREGTARAGLAAASKAYTRFGMGLVDFDQDGILDLFQANGRVERRGTSWSEDPYAEPNLVLRGRPGPRFEPLSSRGGTAPELLAASRAAIFGDVDGDGAIDVLVVNRDAPSHLLMNRAAQGRSFVLLRVLDQHEGDAYGARVDVNLGDHTVRREVRAAYSFQASNDPRIHLGLGSTEQITSVRVRYVDGTEATFGPLAARREHVLRYP